ncbi:MAG TPA: phosphoglucosamine mutase [Acidimicrobiales bacterium]|nr:phosphoglucosamine mutase [Acidimicrobiales bacterium]
MSLKFGTDGVRGVANDELTPELVLALGRAAARVLGTSQPYLIGRDTRVSGPLLQSALMAGLASEGASVVDLGVIPTPGVAALAAARGHLGAMISASHNPFPDNGVKFFARGGVKLSDAVEETLEGELASVLGDGHHPPRPTAGELGRITVDDGGSARAYEQQLLGTLEGRRLDGLRLVLDCAHGASAAIAPRLFDAAGASVTVLYADPNGTNINDGCGSTHPESLQAEVQRVGADVGLAFDGDADRVLAVDAGGNLVDGDQILAVCALDRRERGLLPDDTLVVTVMANLGLRIAMERHGVTVVETAVGDRYVLEAMQASGWTLGGEQSGHIVFRDLATTGDGMLTGLQVADVVARSGKPLAELASVMTRLPQVMINVRGVDCARLDGASRVWSAVDKESAALGHSGRVLLRRSGTEPIVRVMVEAATQADASAAAERIAGVVEAELSLG